MWRTAVLVVAYGEGALERAGQALEWAAEEEVGKDSVDLRERGRSIR